MKADDLLPIALDMAVPLWIEEYRYKPWDEIQRSATRAGQIIASKGDVLMYGGKGCSESFNALAAGVAALAFCPGGVTAFGRHWEAKHKENPPGESGGPCHNVAIRG